MYKINTFLSLSFLLTFFTILIMLPSCGNNPEKNILGDWKEQEWDYEKFDGYSPKDFKKIDGVDLRNYSDRNLIRHEAEIWRFKKNGDLELVSDQNIVTKAKWNLKGRGHILKIKYADGSFELYDIKELSNTELVMNYDIGMEVRGIAKLRFEKQ